MSNLLLSTAHELPTSIRRRELSATEILEAHLIQIARHNHELTAIGATPVPAGGSVSPNGCWPGCARVPRS